MELFSPRFKEIVIKALDCPKPLLGVIQVSDHPFINQVRKRSDVKIYELTVHNRESIYHAISAGKLF